MSAIVLPPRIAGLLLELTKEADVEAALLKVVSEFIRLKLAEINRKLAEFEKKYGMTFEEFRERLARGEIRNAFSYDVERDFWEWESLVTLKRHYERLRREWGI